jgi:LysM repeat protein
VQNLDAEVIRLQSLLKSLGAQQLRPQPQPQPQPITYAQPRPAEPAPRIVPTTNTPAAQTASQVSPSPQRTDPPRAAPQQRTHVIKPQENLMGIAKRYGVPLEKLLAANRSVDARKLKVGQVIVIPPP